MSAEALRRTLHGSTVFVLLLVPLASWQVFRVVLLGGCAVVVATEVARLAPGAFGRWLARRLPVYRSSEARRLSGGAWLAVGYVLIAWMPAPHPAAGLAVAALADPAASVVGSRWGRGDGKSPAGSVAHLGVALVALGVLGLPWPAAVVGALVGTVLERWPGPLNDNLLVAPGVSTTVWLLV